MKEKFSRLALSACLICSLLLLGSCEKETVKKLEDPAILRTSWVTGTWKQTDVVLAYSIKFAGQQLPVGFSLHNLVSYLPLTGPKITATADNVFTFDAKGTFSVTGATDFILPRAGNAGTWNLQAYGSALHLVSSDNKDTPLWVESIDANNLKLGSLGFTVNIYEAAPPKGADVPVYLIFKKQ